MFKNLINHKDQVVIYVAALRDLMPFFHASQVHGILYQGAVLKTTLESYPNAAQHKKRGQDGSPDGGAYASKLAKKDLVESMGCPFRCLWAQDGTEKPLIRGAASTSVAGECYQCAKLFGKGSRKPPMTQMATKIASDGSVPNINSADRLAPYVDEDRKDAPTKAPAQIDSGSWQLNDRRRRRSRRWGYSSGQNTSTGPTMGGLIEEEARKIGARSSGTRRRRRRRTLEGRKDYKKLYKNKVIKPAWFASLLQK